jgi:hypothetical protein
VKAREPSPRRRSTTKLADGDWTEVAKFASYSAQKGALNLQQCQDPPCFASLGVPRLPYDDPRAAREAAELLQRLLRAGLSRYEPDPLRTLEQAKKGRTAT